MASIKQHYKRETRDNKHYLVSLDREIAKDCVLLTADFVLILDRNNEVLPEVPSSKPGTCRYPGLVRKHQSLRRLCSMVSLVSALKHYVCF